MPTLRDMLPPSPEQLQQQIIGDNQFYRGLVTGTKGITSGSLANDALNAEAAGAANANALREQALASQRDASAYAPRVSSLRNISGAGDAFDYAAGAVGQGLASMTPTLGAAALTRVPGGGALGRLSAYAGAAGAGYLQEKGEAALGQYSDPTLAAAPVAERQRTATGKGLVNAALEGIVPAGLTTAVGKNGFGRVLAKDFVTEGATEAAQQYVGHRAEKYLDPSRELDPWDIADAFVGGALTGGAVGAVHGAVSTPKDFVSRTTQSMIDAGEKAPSPTEFLKNVFQPAPTEENDPVAAGDNHPDLVDAVTRAGEQAGDVLDQFTMKRNELAKQYADELLADEKTPAAVREQITAMNGDYESPQNQAAIGAQYVGRKAGEVASQAATTMKELATKFKDGVTNRVVKKNLQETPVTPEEEFALHRDIIDNLTPAAKRRTDIIADIPQIAKGVSGVINKMAQARTAPTDANITNLQQLYAAASTLFADPESVLTKLAAKVEAAREGAKKPTPFMDLLTGVTTAQQDVKSNEGGSFLRSRLVAPMSDEQISQVARFVDEFGMTDMKNSKQADKVLDGLAVAFGGKQEALQVLDYYSKANRLNAKQLLQYDENELLDPESGVTAQDLTPTRTYSFADAKTNRPFRRMERTAKLDAASLREGVVASDSAKVTTIPYSQYADETGKDHKAETIRIMNDVKSRREAALLGYASELGIKGDKAAKLEAAFKAAAERRPSPDAKSTRLADIEKLQTELDLARRVYAEEGPKGVLDLYEVNAAEQNEKDDLTATDEDIKAMATNKNDEDKVSFTKKDGSKMVLSASSMMLTQAAKEKASGRAARGDLQGDREKRLMKEAIASVLAREDIASMDEKTTPAKLKTFPRSDETKAALREQEASVAELKKRTDVAVTEYEDNDDVDNRDKIRTGIERNIARLQTQYEQAEGKAPLRAVIRQRQAVYKEALAAINDIDFQEKVDRQEQGEEAKEGSRRYQEETGEQLAAYGNLDKPTRSEVKKKSKQDKQDPTKGEAKKFSQQEVLDEIERIRGKDVEVAFKTFAEIEGSGDFSMDADKKKRLIRIATDAANMKSVAWHESLHDFIAMLGGTREERRIKREMLEATGTPAIMAQLRDLLKDHPAALKQLDDPEERLAYVYQFWAEGALELSPRAGTLIGKIAQFIRDMFGVLTKDAKLEEWLAALHRGELTQPSTVAQVLAKLNAETVGDKLERLAGPLADGLSRVFTTATDRLRSHGIEELDQLADMFHKDPGHEKGAAGMLQRRAQKEGQFTNAYQKLVDDTTAAQRLEALTNLQSMKAPSNDLERGLTSLLNDMFKYMDEAGVATFDPATKKWKPVNRVEKYFPRNWDADSIRKDEAGFKDLLKLNGVSPQQVDAIYKTLVFDGGSLDLMENEKSLGFVPLAVHVNNRALTFINDVNAPLFAKYQNKDLTDIMTTYIRQAAHRAEYARAFGNAGERIQELLKAAREKGLTHKEEEALIPTIQGLEGTLGHDMDPALKRVMGGVLTVENVLLMPMAIFSQFIDPINIAMRTNSMKDAGQAYLQSLKDLKRLVTRDKSFDYDRELTKMLGIISTDNMLETMGQTQGSMYMSKTMRDINKQFFRYNGMEGWNNSMRVAATVAGERYLLANTGNERAMEEVGLDPKNVKVLPEGTKVGEPGRMAITKQQFESLGMTADEAQTAAEQVQEAMFRFVDGAVVRPNAAHRATWMSDPRFQLVSHLKQFTYSFQAVVLNRAKNENLHGNNIPLLLLASSVPIMFAADMAKWLMTGTVPANWTFFDYFTHAVARSGVLGKYEYAARAVEDAAHGNVPGISFAGPTVEHANILAQWIAGAQGVSTDRLIDRSIPLARYA